MAGLLVQQMQPQLTKGSLSLQSAHTCIVPRARAWPHQACCCCKDTHQGVGCAASCWWLAKQTPPTPAWRPYPAGCTYPQHQPLPGNQHNFLQPPMTAPPVMQAILQPTASSADSSVTCHTPRCSPSGSPAQEWLQRLWVGPAGGQGCLASQVLLPLLPPELGSTAAGAPTPAEACARPPPALQVKAAAACAGSRCCYG